MSWYDFKKNHLFADEILKENSDFEVKKLEKEDEITFISVPETIQEEKPQIPIENDPIPSKDISILQKRLPEIQEVDKNKTNLTTYDTDEKNSTFSFVKKYLWLGISAILALLVGLLGFKDELFSKKYCYSFIDADRNSKINAELQVQILKENESPILYVAKPNEPFVYTTKSKSLTMVVSSPYYKTDTIQRNLETAPEDEDIELKPNDYAIMLFYYSKSLKDLKKKRESLNYLISNNALIYQVFDNQFYGVETMDKQRYINLVTLPSTSLENLDVIDTQADKSGKIVMIKFKIDTDEEKK